MTTPTCHSREGGNPSQTCHAGERNISITPEYQPTPNEYQPTSQKYSPTPNEYRLTSQEYQPTPNEYRLTL